MWEVIESVFGGSMDHMPFAGGAAGAGGVTVWLIKTFVDRRQDSSLKKIIKRLDTLEEGATKLDHKLETNQNADKSLEGRVDEVKKGLEIIQNILMTKGAGTL